jgi:hypothetical protein
MSQKEMTAIPFKGEIVSHFEKAVPVRQVDSPYYRNRIDD